MYSVAPSVQPIPLPPSLVATPLPDTAATLRVPPTDVAASFSNTPINNNAKGSGSASTSAPAAQVASAAQGSTVASPSPTPSLAGNAQTNFLAQLISQDSSPQASIYLAQYDKLVYFSSVKYKPSNAGKPVPQGLFEKLLSADQPQKSQIVLEKAPVAVLRISNNAVDNKKPVQETDVSEATQLTNLPVEFAPRTAAYVPDPVILAARSSKAYNDTIARNDVLLSEAPPATKTLQ